MSEENGTEKAVLKTVNNCRRVIGVMFIVTVLSMVYLFATGKDGGKSLLWLAFFLLLYW